MISSIDHAAFADIVHRGALELGVALTARQVAQLLAYLTLLSKWNAVYNLTAIREPAQMVTQHLLDSLSLIPALAEHAGKHTIRLLDVGAGGGLPGIVIAIWAKVAQPSMSIDLIDTVRKKTAFLIQAKTELGLSNVTIHTGRVEQLDAKELFNVITSRAFAELSDFINWSAHLLAPDGIFVAMKGVLPEIEIQRLTAGWSVQRIQALSVPMLSCKRHLIWIGREVKQINCT
jgi:16S rRNA (guanine527-N7)-methyltransferase